jgi:hypothetical protein
VCCQADPVASAMAAKLGSFDQDLVALWVHSNVVVQLGGVPPLGLPVGQGADQ